MDNNKFRTRTGSAFGMSMVFGGIGLLFSVAIFSFGTQDVAASGASGPLAQGTQPIPVLTISPTALATDTVVATATRQATTTAELTRTVIATETALATGTVVGGTPVTTGTAVSTVVATTTSVASTTSVATATTEIMPTSMPTSMPTEVGMVETPTPVSVGMPRTGALDGGGNSLMLTLLIIGVMMTTIGLASLAGRKSTYRR